MEAFLTAVSIKELKLGTFTGIIFMKKGKVNSCHQTLVTKKEKMRTVYFGIRVDYHKPPNSLVCDNSIFFVGLNKRCSIIGGTICSKTLLCTIYMGSFNTFHYFPITSFDRA